jgi:hypothetical protein
VRPPAAIGLTHPIADVVDNDVRSAILARYRQALATNAGTDVVSRTALADHPDQIATALVMESVHAGENQRSKLAEELVDLCHFMGSTPSRVVACRTRRLRWLGYSNEDIATLHQRVVPIGGDSVRAVASAEGFGQLFFVVWVLAGLLGVGSCGAYLVADLGSRCSNITAIGSGRSLWDYVPGIVGCGPGLLGLAGVLGGWLGSLAGLAANGLIEKNTETGTRQRTVGRAIAMTIAVGVAAASLVPAFLAQR